MLNPASTKELYFVATGKGDHVFAETVDEHYANVKKWRVIEREIREKEKERDAKAEKEKEAKADKDSKAKAPAPGSPPPSKGPDRSKGAVTSKSGATEQEAWSSTTEPAQPKAKR